MKLYIYLSVIVAAAAGVLSAAFYIYDKGGDNVRDEIQQHNNNMATRANERAMSYVECDKLDGVYDFYTGKCRVDP